MKYEIYNSTGGHYNGVQFECEHAELCIEALERAVSYHLEENKINKKGDIYVYGDSHIILLIKEVK